MKLVLAKKTATKKAVSEEPVKKAATKTAATKKPAASKKVLGAAKKSAPKAKPEVEEEDSSLFPEEFENGGRIFKQTSINFKELKEHFNNPHSGYPFHVLVDEGDTGEAADLVELAIVAAIASVHMVDISSEDGFEDRILITSKEFNSRSMKGDEDADIPFAVYLVEEEDD